LAYDKWSRIIRPTVEKEQQLNVQIGPFLSELLGNHETAFELNYLTHSQIQCLLKYLHIENLQKMVSKFIVRSTGSQENRRIILFSA
jgi:hypothetical protein